MAAEEHHGERTALQQRRQRDETPGLVRQHERRHRIARARRVLATAVPAQSRHQAIDGLAIGRKDRTAGVGIGAELFVQRAVHVTAALEGKPELFGVGWRESVIFCSGIPLANISFRFGRPQGAAAMPGPVQFT